MIRCMPTSLWLPWMPRGIWMLQAGRRIASVALLSESSAVLSSSAGTWHMSAKAGTSDYDASQRDDDEPLYKLDRHEIRQGEYVSVTEHDGVLRTFKVAAVSPEQ